MDPDFHRDDKKKTMLPKSQRLNLKTDFKWIASGKKLETKYLKLFIKLSDNPPAGSPREAGGPKIGIAAPSKTFRKATQRNRAKRIVSSAIESLYLSLPANTNILALPKAGVIRVKSQDVLLDLEEVLKDEKIIH